MSNRPTISAARVTGRSAALTAPAVLAALLLVAAGVAVAQQALVRLGAITGQGWAAATLVWLENLTRGAAVAIGAGVVLLGVLVIWLAISVGRTRESDLPARQGLVMGHGDVARLSSAAARTVGGVLTASSVATGRRVSVHVASTGSLDAPQQVENAVARALGDVGLDRTVSVTTDVPTGHGGRSAPASPASETAAPAPVPATPSNRNTSEVPHA